jgi:hypothetical protein
MPAYWASDSVASQAEMAPQGQPQRLYQYLMSYWEVVS